LAFNLLDTAKNYFSSEFVNQASSGLGESGGAISKALTAIIPAGPAGILSKAASVTDGASSILNMAKVVAGGLSATPNFSSLSNSQATAGGGNILSSIFGNNASGILGTISKFAGIKDSSASSLMSAGMPAMLGLLGKHAEQNNLTPGGYLVFYLPNKIIF
jgi:hypothetical protein